MKWTSAIRVDNEESGKSHNDRRALERPDSHKWTLGMLVSGALLFGTSLLENALGDYPDSAFRFLGVVNLVCCLFPIVYLVYMERSKLTFYGAIACLLMLNLQFVFLLFLGSVDMLFLLIFSVPTILWFAFDYPSRAYFGFPVPKIEPRSTEGEKHLDY